MDSLRFFSSVVFLCTLFLSLPVTAQSDDGVATYVKPTCGASIVRGMRISLGDLSDKSTGPALMRDMFCGTYDTKPQGATYELCSDSEKNDCSREEKKSGYDLKGSYHRQVAERNRAECLQAFQFIIDDCLKSGALGGKVEFGNGAYKYEMTVSEHDDSSNTTPAQNIQCRTGTLEQPQPFDPDLLYYMREAYCAAGGCEGRIGGCQVTVGGPGYVLVLEGNIPKDQTATQFSQNCYDATEALIGECWSKNVKGGVIQAGGEGYGWYFSTEPQKAFEDVPVEP